MKSENDFIGYRMSWLMTLNSFLVGGAALLVANAEKFSGGPTLGGTLLVVSILGSASNASCLFSNIWATVAIRGAGLALDKEWENLPPEIRAQKVARMRLYGRDPNSFDRRGRSITWWMHPWVLLPSLFTVVFVLLPFVSPMVTANDTDLSTVWHYTSLLIVSPFIIIPAVEHLFVARNARKRKAAQPLDA